MAKGAYEVYASWRVRVFKVCLRRRSQPRRSCCLGSIDCRLIQTFCLTSNQILSPTYGHLLGSYSRTTTVFKNPANRAASVSMPFWISFVGGSDISTAIVVWVSFVLSPWTIPSPSTTAVVHPPGEKPASNIALAELAHLYVQFPTRRHRTMAAALQLESLVIIFVEPVRKHAGQTGPSGSPAIIPGLASKLRCMLWGWRQG